MASKISGSRKLRKSLLPKFETDVYSKLPAGELIVFAVNYLVEQKIETSLEDIVSICFLLFPQKFGLKKYPKWPDSALVGRRWGDARKKRYIAVNTDFGYKLTSKGLRIVKKVSKALGLVTPKLAKKAKSVKRTAHVKKASPAPVMQAQKLEVKLQPAAIETKPIQEEKVVAPETVKKKLRPVRAKKVSVTPVKQVKKVTSVQEEKATQLELIKAPSTSAPVKQGKRKKAKPVAEALSIQPEKTPSKIVKPTRIKETKPAEAVIIQQVKVEKTQAAKVKPAVSVPVNREAKERAAKFTRMMERSDAYLHYKKNGSNSKINEFDFRSLLLCTMESSAETLVRNVELFKGYAEIQNRLDLTAFLNYCEDNFPHLLKPQNKLARKAKK